MSGPQTNPIITQDMRDRAATAPNAWLPVVTLGVDGKGNVLSDAVLGRYRIDHQGRITDDYVPNPRYRPLPVPQVTEAMRETARSRPGGWIEIVDPIHQDPAADVPPAGVVGRYPVDPAGNLVEKFQLNPGYRPSPVALGWATPRSELEAAMQLAHTGQIDKHEVVLAVLAAELIMPADPARTEREHLVFRTDGGRRVLDAFVSDTGLPADWPPHWQRYAGVEIAVLLDRLGEPVDLVLHGVPDLEVRIPGDVLTTGLAAAVA
jgi:hypothetical protein